MPEEAPINQLAICEHNIAIGMMKKCHEGLRSVTFDSASLLPDEFCLDGVRIHFKTGTSADASIGLVVFPRAYAVTYIKGKSAQGTSIIVTLTSRRRLYGSVTVEQYLGDGSAKVPQPGPFSFCTIFQVVFPQVIATNVGGRREMLVDSEYCNGQ